MEEAESEESSRKAKIKWPSLAEKQAEEEMDEDLTRVLELNLKGKMQNKLQVLGETIYSYGVEKFGTAEVGKEKQKGKGRKEREIERAEAEGTSSEKASGESLLIQMRSLGYHSWGMTSDQD